MLDVTTITADTSDDFDLMQVVAVVDDAIESAPDGGRFGRKVYISAVADEIAARFGQPVEATRAWLRAWVPRLNREFLINATRADLVQVMDPAIVLASEVRADGAEFHFLTIAA